MLHKETQQEVALLMGITIRVADTHGSQEPPPCLIIKNSSSALAQISMNGTKVPLAPLFANARNGFEEIIDVAMPLDEYKILDGMVADDNFNVGQHIQTQKSLTLDKEDPWKMKQQQTSIGNTLLTTLMPSLTSSPHRLARRESREIREVIPKGGVPEEAMVRTLPEPASPVPTWLSSSPTKKKEEGAFTEEDVLNIQNVEEEKTKDEDEAAPEEPDEDEAAPEEPDENEAAPEEEPAEQEIEVAPEVDDSLLPPP